MSPNVTVLALLAGGLVFSAAEPDASRADAGLMLRSSDAKLVAGFEWAKRQALAYAFDGDPVGPWYEAALPGREAFCMRDVSHQATGAHALGLAKHNKNMLRRFAASISASRDWCGYWEIDRYNRPAPADYVSDADFWYNLPANFDVLDACYRMLAWSGDLDYLNDPTFRQFYDRTVSEYVSRWDLGVDGIMKRQRRMNVPAGRERRRFGMSRGIPGYDEGNPNYVLGVDLLDAQYSAYLAYARMEQWRGNQMEARVWLLKAAAVRELVNNAFWDSNGMFFYSHVGPEYKMEGRGGQDLLYRDIVDDGPKAQGALNAMLDGIRKDPSSRAVEIQSHQAEVLYRYGVPDAAYAQMLDLTRAGRERREYPEVAFSVVGAMVTGLMGITVDPTPPFEALNESAFIDRILRTLPGLSSIAWAEMTHLPVRANEVAVRHDGNAKTTVTNIKGPALVWEASFEGSHSSLLVNGRPTRARASKRPVDRAISSVRVYVGAGTAVTVEAPK